MKASAVALLALASSAVSAKRTFVQRLPNGANVPGVEALGHTDKTGDSSSRNAFGRAFYSAGNKWTVALCEADTDGDGQTNGQELGDPCCKWTPGATLTFTTGVSHPSDSSSKADPALWVNVRCLSTTETPSPTPSTSSSQTPANASSSPPSSEPSTSPTTATTGATSLATEYTTRSRVALVVGLVAGAVAGIVALGAI